MKILSPRWFASLRLYFAVVAAIFLARGVTVAQDLPDAPSVTVGSFPSTASLNQPVVHTRGNKFGTPVAAKAPLIDPQVADSSYWAATGALATTTILNVELTARCAQQGTCLTWISPGTGASHAQLYAYTVPTNIALDYLGYKLKQKSRFWMVPQMIFTSANLFSAGRSYGRLQLDLVGNKSRTSNGLASRHKGF